MTSHRIASLRADIKQALRTVSYGTPEVMTRREYLLDALVYELIELHRVVPRLKSLREQHWHQLVTLWRKKGNQPKTIINKLSTFRQLIGRYVDLAHFPSNAELGLEKIKKNTLALTQPAAVTLEHITDKVVYSLCALQRYFGLKKQETIRVEGFMLTNEALYLSRSAAYNSQNRVIPIEEQEQQHLVEQLQQSGFSRFVTPVYDATRLAMLHRIQLSQAGVMHDDYFRHQYALSRYRVLRQHKRVIGIWVVHSENG